MGNNSDIQNELPSTFCVTTFCSPLFPFGSLLPVVLAFRYALKDACEGGSDVQTAQDYCAEGYEGPCEHSAFFF